MPAHAPATILLTHEVLNQPDDFAGRNLFTGDLALREAALREGGEWLRPRLSNLGEIAGSHEVLELGELANRNPPELVSFDRYGRRLDEVRFHPAYHSLMAIAMEQRIHDLAWVHEGPGGHVGHAALLALFTQAEAGTMCPMSMTYSAVPALRRSPAGEAWLGKLIGGRYDPALAPLERKQGVTIGMAMTEKQGGSDVRANSSRAFPIEGNGSDSYRLVGHKWFCSAPMSDAFLTLAYAPGGLTCFLVPRIGPGGDRNAIQLMRLKDKLGNRSNASAEIEYHDSFAWRIGAEGEGVRTIVEMVHHTRLGTVAGTLGIMRMALASAVHHSQGRFAFQKRLIDQPAMAAVLADLAVEYEAAVLLVMRVARAFDGADEKERAFARLAVAAAKFWLTKRCPNFVYECMECLGGAGYVEESPLPRLFRESPLNAIWEGSGNVIALDLLRTLAREPLAIEALADSLSEARGADPRLDKESDRLISRLRGSPPGEGQARYFAELIALLLQAALVVRFAPSAVADLFLATRIGDLGNRSFGAFESAFDIGAVLARADPGQQTS